MKRKRKTELQEARMELEKVIKSKRPGEKIRFEDFLAQYGDYPINPHLHTTKQLNKMTKKGLIRLVVKLEKFIVKVAYQMYKAKLPRLRKTKQKKIPLLYGYRRSKDMTAEKMKRLETEGFAFKKRKFSAKQLAAQRLFAKRARAGTLKRRRR